VRALLDTCTFIWLVEGSPALSRAAVAAIRDPANSVLLSPISSWEIAIKARLGRLSPAGPVPRLVSEGMSRHGIEALPVTHAHAFAVEDLPLRHRDPFDRLLVAQCVVEGLALISPDEAFSGYPVETLW